MRPLLIGLLLSSVSFAQERTWTITTAVVTTEAELVGIRGDIVYLKVGDKIESVPLARLSVADHDFLASVSLAPVRSNTTPGGIDLIPPAGQGSEVLPSLPANQPTFAEEAIPLPGNVNQPAVLTGQGTNMTSARGSNISQATTARSGTQSSNRASTATTAQRRGATTTITRRPVTQPTNQLQTGPRGNANSNEQSGVLGIRDRRNSRQRGR